MMDADYRTPFERMCRVPGTRCNSIMEMIERGQSDEEIANTIKRTPWNHRRGQNPNTDCDARTIRVYRKALNGTLTEASGEAFRTDDKPVAALVYRMREQGMKNTEISAALGLTRNQVDHYFRKRRKRSEKKAPENTGGGKRNSDRPGAG